MNMMYNDNEIEYFTSDLLNVIFYSNNFFSY